MDEYIVWSRERFEKYCRQYEIKKAWFMWKELMDSFAAKEFYAVLDIHGLFLTGLIASKIKAERRIGLEDARELNSLFMTETVKPNSHHMTERYTSILQPLGIFADNEDMTLVVSDKEKNFAAKFLQQAGVKTGDRLAVLVPGTTWPSKNWSPEFFAKTAALIAGDFKSIICGGITESKIGQEIESRVGNSLINAIGKTTLLEMASILEHASVVVAGDTGPLHMAAALKVPTVVIFGPSDPNIYKPLGDNSITLFHQLRCSFCHKQKCPTGKNECMERVLPSEVANAIYKLVNV